MSFNIIPYVHHDEKWSVPDIVWAHIWQKIEDQGLHTITWRDGELSSAWDFFRFLVLGKSLVFIVMEEDKIIGMCWLNSFHKEIACGHFIFFREVWGKKTIEAGRAVLDYWFAMEKDGRKLFKVIVGRTPADNKLAVSFIKRIGFEVLGEIPHYGVMSFARNNQL